MIPQSLKNALKQLTPLYKVYKILFRNSSGSRDTNIPDMDIKRGDILSIAHINKNATVFIETGTYFGDTTNFFKDSFTTLYSIELSEELAEKAKRRFESVTNIKIVQGNSKEQINNILDEVNSTCLFWLDGHYSTEFWVGNEYIRTAKGDKVTPILDELSQIAKHSIKNHVILIDDARLFNGNDDYPKIETLKKFVAKKFPQHRFEIQNDIIRILP